jgi:hypothetical protein
MTLAWQTPAYWKAFERRGKQRRAAYLLRLAVSRGDLIRGECAQKSGDCRGSIHGHHEDYDRPLEVVWLCARHHRQLHTAERRAHTQVTTEPDAIPQRRRPAPTTGG